MAASGRAFRRGYDVDWMYSPRGTLRQPEIESLRCMECRLILREPMQVITCGHRLCGVCYEQLAGVSPGPFSCRVDNQMFQKDDVRKDKGCQKEMESLTVDCPHMHCPWRGKLTEIENHEEECPNKPSPCPNGCSEILRAADMEGHMISRCPKRLSDCSYCKENIPLDKMQEHHGECSGVPVTCDFCFKSISSRKNLGLHLKNECEENILECPFENCNFQGKRSDLVRHSQVHMDEIYMLMQAFKQKEREIRHLHVTIKGIKQEMEEVQQTQLLKINDSIQTMQDSLTHYAVAIDEVRLRQDVLDVKTTNGILIWKIPDIRRRYRDAVDRRTISLYSPPFYTSPHGYRMCIRTYLNGDGIGKGTHLSIFFVVMRSEHDNLLNWPFKQSVRFTLNNQKNPGGSITEAFVPDPKSPLFQRPENDMNIASGFPKFARQSVFDDENFTVGNVIYIKCQVDLTGLTAE